MPGAQLTHPDYASLVDPLSGKVGVAQLSKSMKTYKKVLWNID